ncbi:metallophosphoesterase family protein [Paludisphaera soli]|uniref:metallophosphoesterase family protein n=1 Tax=Paludisphaera soli TaxID=2712865 RepID=UPI0013EE2A01|nr:metallophosphoesterase [Paludisphaera soli]
MDANNLDLARIGRRAFLQGGVLVLGAATTTATARVDEKPGVRFGLITDLHYADKPPAGTRHYRETPAKLAEAAERFKRDKAEFLVELGDLIDAADSVEVELAYLDRIDRELAAIAERRRYVLGNHCVDTLTKAEFLGKVGQERSFDSFDAGGWHFVLLDACFRGDGEPYGRKNFEWTDANIPAHEIRWLRDDLAATSKPTIVFAHQRLDVEGPHTVKNAAEVRAVLESSGRVRAVFQGHSHKNDYREIAGVHYVTLVAMVEGSGAESSGYALVDADDAGSIRVRGFRKQQAYAWAP